jgi:hypothetical protein
MCIMDDNLEEVQMQLNVNVTGAIFRECKLFRYSLRLIVSTSCLPIERILRERAQSFDKLSGYIKWQ